MNERSHRCGALCLVLLTAVALAACASTPRGEKQIAGTLIGATLGGLLGAQIGDGTGRLAATALGVALGGFIGNEAGRSLDRADEAYHSQAARNALWNSPTGTTSTWRNTASNNGGAVTPTSDAYTDSSGRQCRSFSDEVRYDDGGVEQLGGTACRNPDGSWAVTS